MNRFALVVFLFALSDVAGAVDSVRHEGKIYYKVDAADPSLNSGDKVCKAAGAACLGYTEATAAVCSQFHPGASARQLFGTEASGIFCNGFTITGVCSYVINSCITYPFGTEGVQCDKTISDLYTEMFVECGESPPDGDHDGLYDSIDNCPGVRNLAQADFNGDGVGDKCDDNDDERSLISKISDKSKKSHKSRKSHKSKKSHKSGKSHGPKRSTTS
jgi:hypothetical protein